MRKRVNGWMRAVFAGSAGLLFQASTCQSLSFDSDVFVSESVSIWYANTSAFFILNVLTDVLDVSPADLSL